MTVWNGRGWDEGWRGNDGDGMGWMQSVDRLKRVYAWRRDQGLRMRMRIEEINTLILGLSSF